MLHQVLPCLYTRGHYLTAKEKGNKALCDWCAKRSDRTCCLMRGTGKGHKFPFSCPCLLWRQPRQNTAQNLVFGTGKHPPAVPMGLSFPWSPWIEAHPRSIYGLWKYLTSRKTREKILTCNSPAHLILHFHLLIQVRIKTLNWSLWTKINLSAKAFTHAHPGLPQPPIKHCFIYQDRLISCLCCVQLWVKQRSWRTARDTLQQTEKQLG